MMQLVIDCCYYFLGKARGVRVQQSDDRRGQFLQKLTKKESKQAKKSMNYYILSVCNTYVGKKKW